MTIQLWKKNCNRLHCIYDFFRIILVVISVGNGSGTNAIILRQKTPPKNTDNKLTIRENTEFCLDRAVANLPQLLSLIRSQISMDTLA